MKVTIDDVNYIARLSRLELSSEEMETMRGQINDILLYIDKLNELDTSGISPTSHILDISNIFRQDEASHSLDVEKALSNAPDRHSSYFKVPKIIE